MNMQLTINGRKDMGHDYEGAKTTNKVKAAMSKTAREVPIIAWAVEIDGKIDPQDVFRVRSSARDMRNDLEAYSVANRIHVRKVKLQVIPGR